MINKNFITIATDDHFPYINNWNHMVSEILSITEKKVNKFTPDQKLHSENTNLKKNIYTRYQSKGR